jgi:hypothetical protein
MYAIKSVIITTAAPRGNDPGSCEIGFYTVAKGIVVMCTEEGRPTGKRLALGPGDDPDKVAGRLLRESWLKRGGENNFNRQIIYPRSGVA